MPNSPNIFQFSCEAVPRGKRVRSTVTLIRSGICPDRNLSVFLARDQRVYNADATFSTPDPGACTVYALQLAVHLPVRSPSASVVFIIYWPSSTDWSIGMHSSLLDYWSWLWLSFFTRRTRIRLANPPDYIMQPTNHAMRTSRHASWKRRLLLRLRQLLMMHFAGFKSKASSALQFIRMNVRYDDAEARQKNRVRSMTI